jgi:hypothetical protein
LWKRLAPLNARLANRFSHSMPRYKRWPSLGCATALVSTVVSTVTLLEVLALHRPALHGRGDAFRQHRLDPDALAPPPSWGISEAWRMASPAG